MERWRELGSRALGLTGRLGGAPLDGLVATLLADSGVTGADVAALGEGPDGYVVDRPMAPRAALEPLAKAYAFDAAELSGALTFGPRGGLPVTELTEDDLVLARDGAPFRLVRAQETELPREVSLAFSDASLDHRRTAVSSRRLAVGASRVAHADLAVVTYDAAAERRADIWLQDLWASRESADFALPPSRLALTPGDVIALTLDGRRRLFELRELVDAEHRAVRARSIDPEVFDLPLAATPRRRVVPTPAPVGPVHALLLDLPTLGSETPPVLTRIAVFAPLGEDSEAYELDVMSGATVLRILSSSAPSVLYPAAAELADFGALQASVSIRVVQMSTAVGRGVATTAVLQVQPM